VNELQNTPRILLIGAIVVVTVLVFLPTIRVVLGLPSSIWHLASTLTHLGATIAVLMLIHRMTRDFIGAALATALFAIHPIHTEAVAWILDLVRR